MVRLLDQAKVRRGGGREDDTQVVHGGEKKANTYGGEMKSA
jgi:hypothetical protein